MKVAVVTAMSGDYDNLTNPEYQDKDFDYYFFTDTDKEIKGYKTEKIEEVPNLHKQVKIITYDWFIDEGYDVFIWHDANMHQVASLKPLLASVDKPMAFLNHPSRNCVVEEVEAIAAFKKANIEDVCKEVQGYLSEGMPPQFGLWECGVNIKFNTFEVNRFCDEWMHNLGKSNRDQLSFAYTLWKNPIDINWLHTSTYRGREFKISPHKS